MLETLLESLQKPVWGPSSPIKLLVAFQGLILASQDLYESSKAWMRPSFGLIETSKGLSEILRVCLEERRYLEGIQTKSKPNSSPFYRTLSATWAAAQKEILANFSDFWQGRHAWNGMKFWVPLAPIEIYLPWENQLSSCLHWEASARPREVNWAKSAQIDLL